ncbi:MAG: Holliday junction resolvase RuvX [Oscillospiraceae bacterium]|jgi:putative Holliday junction resolvase|nr:Holliday junction resolvase RuvX [Oscillospiraceae bacterium]
MRIMAVDYGDRRTGIAVSDLTNSIVGQAWTVTQSVAARLVELIAAEARSRGVGTIVVGSPRNMDGTFGSRAEKSAGLAEALRAETDCDVRLWDERRTTVDAHRILSEANRRGEKRKQSVDAVAASLILEGYLNSIK